MVVEEAHNGSKIIREVEDVMQDIGGNMQGSPSLDCRYWCRLWACRDSSHKWNTVCRLSLAVSMPVQLEGDASYGNNDILINLKLNLNSSGDD